MAENTPRSLSDHNYAASLKEPPVNRPTPDGQDKSEWLISEDDSILQVIRDQQCLPLSLTTLKPGHIPNWDLVADAVNSVSRVYKSARNCKARFENVLMLRKEGSEARGTTNHLYKPDMNASYTSIFRKRCKGIAELAENRKAQAKSVRIQNQKQKVQLTTAQIQLQQVQPQQVSITGGTGTVVKTGSAPSSVAIPISAVTMGSVNKNVSLPQGKSGVQTKGATTITNQQSRQLQLQQQLLNQAKKGSKVTTNLTELAKVPKRGSMMSTAFISAPVNAVGNSQQVKGLPTAMTVLPIQRAMKSMPQNRPVVPKRGSMMSTAFISAPVNAVGNSQQVKGLPTAMTVLPIQRAMKSMPQNRPVVPKRGSMMSTAFISAPVNAVGNSQQVKGLPTAMTVLSIQRAMKSMPQNRPVVVTATPSLPGIQHTVTALSGEPDVVASSVKAQLRNPPK